MSEPNVSPDAGLLDDSFHFSFDSAVGSMEGNLLRGEKSLQVAMKKLQKSNNPNPANLAALQFRINKWTLNFNMFSSMIKSVKDVATATIQKI
jgi:type III secretion apparatus needle protein